MTTDKLLKIEKAGKVWRAIYAGPNGPATICSCMSKRATELNAEFIMRTTPSAIWVAMISRPNVAA